MVSNVEMEFQSFRDNSNEKFHFVYAKANKILAKVGNGILVKDTHREKAPSNEAPALAESMNIDIWVLGTSNQLFISGSYLN